ncbi:hypothetical protein Hsar01_02101 [Haloferula sargassicola]|uniref:Uncharacterized protein n=2 Tax=Haloferula sargassicola TaxID=490096 RepID=A0ABP9UMR8_9BACT
MQQNGQLGIYSTSVIDGGTVHGEPGAKFIDAGSDEGTLKDVEITGEISAGYHTSIGLAGAIANDGVLGTVADESYGGYRVDEGITATLTGAGDVTLRRNGHFIGGEGTLVNESNTIRGTGEISVASLENQGTIQPEGGTMYLRNTTVLGVGGTVKIAGDGQLGIYSTSVIDGGTVHGEPGAKFVDAGSDEGTLKDVEITGEISAGYHTSIGLAGAIANDGVLGTVADESYGGYRVDEGITATLTGAGDVTLRRNGHFIGGEGTLVNESNTIRGTGEISVASLENQGTIQPEGGAMYLRNTTVLGVGGTVKIAGDGQLGIYSTSVIDGGTVHGEPGAKFVDAGSDEGTLKDVEITGEISAGYHTSIGLAGAIANDGVLGTVADESYGGYRVDEGITATLTGAGDVTLRRNGHFIGGEGTLVNESNTIRGTGEISVASLENQGTIRPEGGAITLGNSTSFSQATSGITDLQGELQIANYAPGSGRLTGIGKLKGDADFSGMHVAPGNGPGILTVEGNSTFAGDSVLEIEIGMPSSSNAAIANDILIQDGNITLAGILDVRLIPGYEPYVNSGLAITIVSTRLYTGGFAVAGTDPESGEPVFLPAFSSSPQGSVTGLFSNLDSEGRLHTSDGQGSFLVTITADAVTLSDFQPEVDPEMTQELALSDDDEDGVPYVLEWLFGSNPNQADSIKVLHASGSMSGAELSVLFSDRTFEPEDSFMTFSFRVRKERGGVILLPQVSVNLAFEESPDIEAVSVSIVDDDPGYEVVTFALIATTGAPVPSMAFLRMDADVSGLPIGPLAPTIPVPPVVIPPIVPPVVAPSG